MQTKTALALPFSLCLAALCVGQTPPAAKRIVPYPIDLSPGFQAAIENGTRTTTGRPGPKYWTNHAAYTLTAELDPVNARLQGRAVMTYHNRSPAAIDRLVVHLYQNLMKAGAERTRTVVPTEGFEIAAIRLGGVQLPLTTQGRDRMADRPVTIRDTLLTVRLPDPLAAGAKATLEIDYAFSVPRALTAPRMGHENDNVYYLGYWYPQFAVYDDVNGWVADQHRGNGEFYMGYADYDLAITAPVGYLVRATGELLNAEEVLTQKARDALAAASTNHEIVHIVDKEDLAAGNATAKAESGKLTWKFRAENVRDAAVSIAKTYLWDATHAVIADKEGPGKNGTAMIHAVYEANAGDWVRAARITQHTIEYMSAHVHPYPWPHMTACEGIIGGGMEYPMMTICGGRQSSGVIPHETIHMWFPMLVGNNEKRYAWQDEGFTSFWTTLCRGDFAATKNGPQRAILSYANQVSRGGDVSCMRHADTYGSDDFGFASYDKPEVILHQLRAMLGDETFFAAFRRYAADWAWKHPYPHDFFRTFSDVAQLDLEPYFRTWFFETWQLDHAVESVEGKDGKTLVAIEDRGRAVHPAVVEVTYRDGRKERQTVATDSWWTSTRVVLTFGPDVVAVRIDPDTASLDCDRKNNSWSQKQ